MLCLHCSLPTSDPRAPEQREPSRLLTGINWAPRGLQRLSGNRWPPAGQLPKKSPKAAPPIPEIREPGHPRSRHSPRGGPGAQATTERHTRRRTRRVRSSPPPAEQRTTRRGTARHPAATTAPPETPTTTLHYLTKHGEEPPILTSRPTFASGHDQRVREFTRGMQGRPAGTELSRLFHHKETPWYTRL